MLSASAESIHKKSVKWRSSTPDPPSSPTSKSSLSSKNSNTRTSNVPKQPSALKKEEEAAGAPPTHTNPIPDISENIRTIQVEAIQYLTADYLPTTSQTPTGISQLVKDLAPYELTKAEKLQIVNLAPTAPVELYVIVEELEDRLGESMDSILSTVQASLSEKPKSTTQVNGTTKKDKQPLFLKDPSGGWDDVDADAIIDDLEFVDHGEGAGIEGDLDLEED
ncbi:hypothetical protein NP233_g10584 [Leucocoprinus birnbaumii]|uniref:DNA-directed RNA polymerase III subunit RPC9 n=1 Tax=Leucocoprinus birnbaumii TaxID=56174 RepID=A0AAD5YRS1_9AGAR|nr:hypothetical protein NP233_g10584 [Leucocoprinus birnbaumii]